MSSRRLLVIALPVLLLGLGALGIGLLRPTAPPLPRLGRVPEFTLTDQQGRPVSAQTLRGRVWVANFMFTSCAGVCPVLTRRVLEVQRWAEREGHAPDALRLVSFSVEPERDTPERLAAYAAAHGADPARWSFLTGPYQEIERAVVAGFKQGLTRERPGPGEPPGDGQDGMNILHASRLVLVDTEGFIRGYYEAEAEGLVRLEEDAARLIAARGGGAASAWGGDAAMGTHEGPQARVAGNPGREALGDLLALVNALLNSTSTVLLLLGWLAIRRRDAELHRKCMMSALVVSALFLGSYLLRMALTGAHRYPGHGMWRLVYLSLLGSHMLLAAITPPLVLRAAYLGLKKRFGEHRRIVRFAYPIWMYVSVTGVLVYLMLYHGPH